MRSLYPALVKNRLLQRSLKHNRDGQEREHCICVVGQVISLKKREGTFTCGRDLFRISMTIDLHVWSSIAGYGSRKRCWLGDQKCGQFRTVVRAHFKLLSSFSPCHEIFSNARLMFILLHHNDLVGVALDVGSVGITKSEAVLRWAIVRHRCSTNTGHCRSASIYGPAGGGGIGGRGTDFFGGLLVGRTFLRLG